jgi:AraC-like DNA-binding protein
VINISTVEATLPPGIDEVVTPYPPTPFQSILFYCNNPISMGVAESEKFELQPHIVLLGPQYSKVKIKVHKQLKAIRVDFFPGGMYRLLGLPMNDLFDKGLDARDIFGSEAQVLNEHLQNTFDLETGKSLVEEFLLAKVAGLKEILPFDRAIKLLLRESGNLTVERSASDACLSIKQFERKCLERIGMPPKTYARILRFSKAYRLHESNPQMSWTSIAHASGYFDQMHMIRDFKTFSGVNPSDIKKELQTTPLRMQKDLPF